MVAGKGLGRPAVRVLSRQALAQQVYDMVKAQIMDLNMDPGARVNMEQIARDLGVSAIPVREAMTRLCAEGLLYGEAYRGYTVTPTLKPEKFRALFRARKLVEGYAAESGAPLQDSALIQELRDRAREMEAHPTGGHYIDYRTFTAADAAFHEAIVRSARNAWLSEMHRILNAHMHLSRLYPLLPDVRTDFSESTAEHARIMEAFTRASGAEARTAVTVHLDRAEARLSPAVQKAWPQAGRA